MKNGTPITIGECCEDRIITTDHRQPEWWHNEEDEKCDICGQVAEAIAYGIRLRSGRPTMDAMLIAERIYAMLTGHGVMAPFGWSVLDKDQFVEDLRNLAEWCDPEGKDGFIPFVDPATGKCPR